MAKLGDIKKFGLPDGKSFVGVVIGVEGNSAMLVTSDGREVTVPKSIEGSPTRLASETRSSLESVYNLYRERNKMFADIRGIEVRIAENKGNYSTALYNLRRAAGLLSSTDFESMFIASLSRVSLSKLNSVDYNFSSVFPNKDSLIVSLEHSVDVERYPSPEQFSFIFREYDNTLNISRGHDSECYNDIVNRFSSKHSVRFQDAQQVFGENTLNAKVRNSLGLGDKSLQFHSQIRIELKGRDAQMTIEACKAMACILNIVLG